MRCACIMYWRTTTSAQLRVSDLRSNTSGVFLHGHHSTDHADHITTWRPGGCVSLCPDTYVPPRGSHTRYGYARAHGHGSMRVRRTTEPQHQPPKCARRDHYQTCLHRNSKHELLFYKNDSTSHIYVYYTHCLSCVPLCQQQCVEL